MLYVGVIMALVSGFCTARSLYIRTIMSLYIHEEKKSKIEYAVMGGMAVTTAIVAIICAISGLGR